MEGSALNHLPTLSCSSYVVVSSSDTRDADAALQAAPPPHKKRKMVGGRTVNHLPTPNDSSHVLISSSDKRDVDAALQAAPPPHKKRKMVGGRTVEVVQQALLLPPEERHLEERHKETLKHFPDNLRNAITDSFHTKPYALEIIKAATCLLETCKNKQIKVAKTFFNMLRFHRIDEHHEDVLKFFLKATIFFAAVRDDIKTTTNLSSMLNKSNSTNINLIKKFTKLNDKNIQFIAGCRALSVFSSMNHGKGLPDENKVKGLLGWDCWKVNGEFNLERLRTFSSMHHGKGLPDENKVNAVLGWDCWKVNGEFNLERLRAFSSMHNGKGLPDENKVNAVLEWLPKNNARQCIMLLTRIFAGSGLPDVKALILYTQTLSEEMNKTSNPMDNDGDQSILKMIALFCAADPKWQLKIDTFKKYLKASKTPPELSLGPLRIILYHHGGDGLCYWLDQYANNSKNKHEVTSALSISAPLERVRYAVTNLPKDQWVDYIALSKNLPQRPTKDDWDNLQPLSSKLDENNVTSIAKRQMIEVLWPFSKDERMNYCNRMQDLFKMVPSPSLLHKLHRQFDQKKMKLFLDACLSATSARTAPSLELLFEGLLIAHLPLPNHNPIPAQCFLNREAYDDGKGVEIKIYNGVANGTDLLAHFISAASNELTQMDYCLKGKQLTLTPYDGEPLKLPKPEFGITRDGFAIKNWTIEQLNLFFTATEFTKEWYLPDQDNRESYAIKLDQRLNQMKIKKNSEVVEPVREIRLISQDIILNIIKIKMPLKPKVWETLSYYAKHNLLVESLCKALQPIIEQSEDGVVPEAVRSYVESFNKRAELMEISLPDIEPISEAGSSLTVHMDVIENSRGSFERIWSQTLLATILNEADLEMLSHYKDKITYEQLLSIIEKISTQCAPEVKDRWQVILKNKKEELIRRDPLGLSLSDDGYSVFLEDDSWLDNLLG